MIALLAALGILGVHHPNEVLAFGDKETEDGTCARPWSLFSCGEACDACPISSFGAASCKLMFEEEDWAYGCTFDCFPNYERCDGGCCPVQFSRVGAGDHYSCASTTRGATYCWGKPSFPEATLPYATLDWWFDPKKEQGDVHVFPNHRCVANEHGIFCKGDSEHGEVGPHLESWSVVTDDQWSPTGGVDHTCLWHGPTGEVRCYGSREYWERGNNTSASLIPDTANTVALAAGDHHTCALNTTGEVRCWGRNHKGQSLPDTISERITTSMVGGLPIMDKVFAGGDTSCGRTLMGDILCWGSNENGQFGDGTTETTSEPAPALTGLTNVSFVDLSRSHGCAIHGEGAVACWGNNDDGQLGDGSNDAALAPVNVSLPAEAVFISVGETHSCAVSSSGSDIWCWGGNGNGQLGDDTFMSSNVPVRMVF